ncbi:Fc.00g083080.m01.CDS01 [Cosmosporella sp. VM-42]
MSIRVVATATLAVIAIFGNYSILGLIQRNGWASMFADAIAQDVATLSSTGQAANKRFTGVPPLDFFLDQLLRFFYPCVSGERPVLSLFAAYFAGQVLPMHTAVVLEGMRTGNKGAIIAFSTIWGSLYQSIPFGIMMPVYCAAYLWSSPLAAVSASLTPAAKVELLSMDAIQIRAVTGAMSLGYIIPTVLPALPVPHFVSVDRQQVFLALWQLFPVWVCLWQFALVAIVRVRGLVPESAQRTPESKIKYSRRVYRYIISLSSVFHFAPLVYALFPKLRSPFFTVSDFGPVDLEAMFVPMSAFSPRMVKSIAEGSQVLLQYDMYCAIAAASVWVAYLSYASSGASIAAGVNTGLKSLVRMVVVGPGGAVLWALWDRDEEALQAVSAKKV